MAARKRKIRHDEATRDKIQTSQLINRLSDHALGKVEMLPSAVRAAEVLLRKTIPDVSAITLSGDPDAPLINEIRMVPVDAGK
jgi:hypothetical protein